LTNHTATRPSLAKAKKIIARKANLGSLFKIFFLDYTQPGWERKGKRR
jgi:hypothetical protein